MNAWYITGGVLLLIWPTICLLQLLFWLLYEMLANNWHEKLLWPATSIASGVGLWMLYRGFKG